MNTTDLKTSILAIGSSDFTREDYLKHQRNISKVLGNDAALCFGDSVECEDDQFFIENPDDLVGLWRRMLRLAKEEGKV
jgi:hypothetical protein